MPNSVYAWYTPLFDPDDPVIPRVLQLRPSLWTVVFALLEDLAKPSQWWQNDPSHATIEEVITELNKARSSFEIGVAMYIGEVREFATADPPDGWLRCNGAVYANVDYPLLAAVINPGLVEDVDHFRVPDRDRRLGMDGITVGMQEGSETHTLTVSELPSHRHAQDQWGVAASTVLGELPGFEAAPVAGFTGYEGGGNAHSILNPVEGTQFYIRAAWPTVGGG